MRHWFLFKGVYVIFISITIDFSLVIYGRCTYINNNRIKTVALLEQQHDWQLIYGHLIPTKHFRALLVLNKLCDWTFGVLASKEIIMIRMSRW